MSLETLLILLFGTPIVALLAYLTILLGAQNKALEALLAARETEAGRKMSSVQARLSKLEDKS